MARVLLIEDEAALRLIVGEVLREAGHEVLLAEDGIRGLAMLELLPLPDLVLMDLLMPRLGGRTVLARLRANPRWRRLPVVLMTGAVYDPTDFPPPGSYQGLLEKPFDLDQLVEAVASCLPARRRLTQIE